jgi:large subunit ribosomal protein L9
MSNIQVKSKASRKKRGLGKIKVILMHSYAKKGKFGDIIEVKKGFAKNFLVPNGIGIFANKANILKFENLKKDALERSEKLKNEALILYEKINALTIDVKVTCGQDGRIFGSITSKNIIDAIRALDDSIMLEKNHIFINVPIKSTGSHNIQFNLNPDVILHKSISISPIELKNLNKILHDEDDAAGYDYSSKINSGDKRFDYLDRDN